MVSICINVRIQLSAVVSLFMRLCSLVDHQHSGRHSRVHCASLDVPPPICDTCAMRPRLHWPPPSPLTFLLPNSRRTPWNWTHRLGNCWSTRVRLQNVSIDNDKMLQVRRLAEERAGWWGPWLPVLLLHECSLSATKLLLETIGCGRSHEPFPQHNVSGIYQFCAAERDSATVCTQLDQSYQG